MNTTKEILVAFATSIVITFLSVFILTSETTAFGMVWEVFMLSGAEDIEDFMELLMVSYVPLMALTSLMLFIVIALLLKHEDAAFGVLIAGMTFSILSPIAAVTTIYLDGLIISGQIPWPFL